MATLNVDRPALPLLRGPVATRHAAQPVDDLMQRREQATAGSGSDGAATRSDKFGAQQRTADQLGQTPAFRRLGSDGCPPAGARTVRVPIPSTTRPPHRADRAARPGRNGTTTDGLNEALASNSGCEPDVRAPASERARAHRGRTSDTLEPAQSCQPPWPGRFGQGWCCLG